MRGGVVTDGPVPVCSRSSYTSLYWTKLSALEFVLYTVCFAVYVVANKMATAPYGNLEL